MSFAQFFLILMFSTGALGWEIGDNDGNFLTADDKFYSVVMGNGRESGFDFKFQARHLKDDQINEVEVVITNHLDNCQLSEIKVENKVHTRTSLSDVKLYDVSYFARIYTNPLIGAESGGCLVQARKNADLHSDVLKIINFYYNSDN